MAQNFWRLVAVRVALIDQLMNILLALEDLRHVIFEKYKKRQAFTATFTYNGTSVIYNISDIKNTTGADDGRQH
jgi:hypothetical protein